MRYKVNGALGWSGLAAYIAAYDIWAAINKQETLSMAFWRSVKHPRRRWLTVVVWGYLTAHLFHALPDTIDPLRMMAKRIVDNDSGGVVCSP